MLGEPFRAAYEVFMAIFDLAKITCPIMALTVILLE